MQTLIFLDEEGRYVDHDRTPHVPGTLIQRPEGDFVRRVSGTGYAVYVRVPEDKPMPKPVTTILLDKEGRVVEWTAMPPGSERLVTDSSQTHSSSGGGTLEARGDNVFVYRED